MTSLTFTVPGKPIPQGSVSSLGKGRPSVHTNRAVLLPWRGQVRACADAARPEVWWGAQDREVPFSVRIVFTVQRPSKAPRRIVHPTTRPDLDKLVRAIFDACTDVLWRDDSQVVRLATTKAFGLPGVRVTVTEL